MTDGCRSQAGPAPGRPARAGRVGTGTRREPGWTGRTDLEAGRVSEQHPDIAGLRQSLDEVDSGIVRLIAQRHEVIAAIAKVKERGASGIQDTERERRVLDSVEAVATDLGVSASLVRRIFRELINDSV